MTKKRSVESSGSEIRIGISSCLLGKKVRFDAGHKHDRYVTDTLGSFVKFVPVCPEIEVGMGVPREAVRLVGYPENPQMVGSRSGEDWSERMNTYALRRVKQKDLSDLSGFILKNRSPSCGMERVKVYIKPDTVERKGTGLFASALLDRFPDLPIEEEGRLIDATLRENFVERVFAYKRLQYLFAKPFARGAIVTFHANHKFLLLAHSTEYYRKLGRLVARIKQISPAQFKKEYRSLFMRTLRFKATVKKNTNVLQHVAGFLKNHLVSSEKSDLHSAIEDYHNSLVPLIVPITMLRHFISKYDVEYISNQFYLKPHPKELMLRNHV
jgi:uncharacterized protein YbgA (DUF1722 family)/uncharacterized protein YbbK (DUF523 family)